MEQLKDSRVVNIRLRIGKDDDLFDAISNLPACTDKSDVGRAALRLWFGLADQSDRIVSLGPVAVSREVVPDPAAPEKPPETKKQGILAPITETAIERAGESDPKDLDNKLNEFFNSFKSE
jgi:hypothetical protein